MNIGQVHLQTQQFLPYLTVAYCLFFAVIFAYVLSLSRRQSRLDNDMALLRRALDEEKRRR
jgi:CcmD family protein